MSDPTGISDDAPGPGWWKASDGRWYPPQSSPAAPPPPSGMAYAVPVASNGLATGSMVTGIVSAVLFWAFGLSAIIGLVAVVLGFVALSKSKQLPNRVGRGQAIAGIATGIVGIGGGVLLVASITLLGQEAEDQFREVGTELGDYDDGVNTDPANGWCDEDRFLQDPDC